MILGGDYKKLLKSVKNPDVILFVARVENDNVKNIEKNQKIT